MASGAGSLEEQVRSAVRSAVREELSSRSGSQSLVERTRQLINASASSASRALNEASALSVEDTKSQTKRCATNADCRLADLQTSRLAD